MAQQKFLKVGEIILSEKNVQWDYFTFAKLKAWSQARKSVKLLKFTTI